MAFDETLAARIRQVLGVHPSLTEKRMFGGLAFMLNGHMFCGIIGEDLMVRVGPAGMDAALALPHARPMDFTGRPLNGYVYVSPEGTGTVDAVSRWVERGAAFVEDLPAKRPKKAAPKPRVKRAPRG
jgi:TfoX/Sxy family transcriptional regulator of competence genes